MRRSLNRRHQVRRTAIGGLTLAAILVGATGTDCDTTEFRAAAADALGSGIKSIFDGLVDGAIAGVWDDLDTTGTSTEG